MSGKLITLEGGEGAGKSSVIASLEGLLADGGHPYVMTREPGGTSFGEALRHAVLHAHDSVAPEAELLAMFSARAQHLHQVIRPALAEGKIVLCDRFVDSSYAYQGGGRGLPEGTIRTLEALFVGIRPSLTLYLDVLPEVGNARVRTRANGPDRIEREQTAFFDNVRAAYLQRARDEPERIKVIDACRPQVEVARSAGQVLASFLVSS